MQRRCKKTLANFDSVPAAKRHFHKWIFFLKSQLDVKKMSGMVSTFMASFSLLAKYSCLFSKH